MISDVRNIKLDRSKKRAKYELKEADAHFACVPTDDNDEDDGGGSVSDYCMIVRLVTIIKKNVKVNGWLQGNTS